jgi:GTPase
MPNNMDQNTENQEAFVAIVGEPNVGKSTLINRLISERAALTSNIPGTTRDRFYASTSWNGVDFTLIDTAGIILEQRDELERNVQKQVDIALDQADLILYVIDGKRNPESINRGVLQKLRKAGVKKDIVLAINKTDSPKKYDQIFGDYQFTGVKDLFPISAISGMGVGDMLDSVTSKLAARGFKTIVKEPGTISVSILGKPNVGKSSLFNKILGEERVVVSSVPGTTRNVIDTVIEYKDQKIKFLDTAGLKKKEKRQELPDIYAGIQTLRAMRKSDICLLVIDAAEGITQQDQRIAGEIIDSGKGLIVLANKIDLLSPEKQRHLEDNLSKAFKFLWWAPAVPISAKDGTGVKEVLQYISKIEANRNKRVDNQELSEFFFGKLKLRQPQRLRDERVPKVFSLRQEDVNPPVFIMTVNIPSAISMQFRKYIENAIIKELDFWGTPVILKLESKLGNPATKALN